MRISMKEKWRNLGGPPKNKIVKLRRAKVTPRILIRIAN